LAQQFSPYLAIDSDLETSPTFSNSLPEGQIFPKICTSSDSHFGTSHFPANYLPCSNSTSPAVWKYQLILTMLALSFA